MIVGLCPTFEPVDFAKGQDFGVKSVVEVSARANVITILAPGQHQYTIRTSNIEPNIKPGTVVAFAHGSNIHYNYIKSPEDHPAFMVAPEGPDHIVRREYTAGHDVPVVVVVEQDPRDDGWALVLAYTKALGAPRVSVIKAILKGEVETNLSGEQNVLMGGVNKLAEMGFEVLAGADYQPRIAYFEIYHELKILANLTNEGGLDRARWSRSDTARYGGYVNTVINEDYRKRMGYHLQRIQNGSFTRELIDDQDAGVPRLKELQEKYSNEHVETISSKLCTISSWNKDSIRDTGEADSFIDKIVHAQAQ